MGSLHGFRRAGQVASRMAAEAEDPNLYQFTNQVLVDQLNDAYPLPHKLPEHLAALSSDSPEENEEEDDGRPEGDSEDDDVPVIPDHTPDVHDEEEALPIDDQLEGKSPEEEEKEEEEDHVDAPEANKPVVDAGEVDQHGPPPIADSPLGSDEESSASEMGQPEPPPPNPKRANAAQLVGLLKRPVKVPKLQPTFVCRSSDDDFLGFDRGEPAGSDDGYEDRDSLDGPEPMQPRKRSDLFLTNGDWNV